MRIALRVVAGLALALGALPVTFLGLVAGEPNGGLPHQLTFLAWMGPGALGLGLAIVPACTAPPGRFLARVGAHTLVLLGLTLAFLAVWGIFAYYGGPCITIVLAPLALALLTGGFFATRAAWGDGSKKLGS